METEDMDYNPGKLKEDMGFLSAVFCRVPGHLFPSVPSTDHLLLFCTSKTNKDDCDTLPDRDGFHWFHDWLSGKSRVPCPVLVPVSLEGEEMEAHVLAANTVGKNDLVIL